MRKELANIGFVNIQRLPYRNEVGVILSAKDKKTGMRYAIKGIKITENKVTNQSILDVAKLEEKYLLECDSPYIVKCFGGIQGREFYFIKLEEC